MAKIVVQRDPDAHDADSAYVAAVTREMAALFAGVRCSAHGVEPQVVATIQKGGPVEIETSVCCRQLAEAVEFVLSGYYGTQSG